MTWPIHLMDALLQPSRSKRGRAPSLSCGVRPSGSPPADHRLLSVRAAVPGILVFCCAILAIAPVARSQNRPPVVTSLQHAGNTVFTAREIA
ncbi:MAG TPA: hypothetical protein VLT13_07255, partial [Bacteroidota bacterium]|nr:hypothetical protein [Bacteroidota bacterium]